MKTHFQFEAICGPKFASFWCDVGDPLWFATHLPAYICRVSFRRYKPLKLPLSCEVVQKRCFWGSDLQGEGVSQISDMRL